MIKDFLNTIEEKSTEEIKESEKEKIEEATEEQTEESFEAENFEKQADKPKEDTPTIKDSSKELSK